MRIDNYEGSWDSYYEEPEFKNIDYSCLDRQDDLAYSAEIDEESYVRDER